VPDKDEFIVPMIDETVIRRALERLRQARPLGDSPLRKLIWIHQRLEHNAPPPTRDGLDVAVNDALAELIEIHLFHLRTVEGLPLQQIALRETALEDFHRDFVAGNTELEAWSALYYRYVRVDLNLQAQEMAHRVGADPRQMRRRFDHGYRRLTEALSRRESAARAIDRRAWMRLKLPPAPAGSLISAEGALGELRRQLTQPDSPRLLTLVGPGGMGKTALAHALARQMIDEGRFEDFAWITLDAPTAYDALLALIAYAIGYPHLAASGSAELGANLRARLASVPTLIVFDNADELAGYPADLARLEQLAGPGRMIIIARQRPPADAPVAIFPITPLSPDDVARLIRDIARQRHIAAAEALNEESMAAIVRAIGGNPLAARVVASQLAYLPLDRILETLGSIPATGDQALFDTLFRQTWESISLNARQAAIALALLSLEGAGWEDWFEIAGLPPEAFDTAIRALVDCSLIDTAVDSANYAMRPLARQFVIEQTNRPPWREKFQGLLSAAAQRLEDEDGDPEPERGLALLRRQVELADSPGDLAGLIRRLAPAVRRSGQWMVWRDALRAVHHKIAPDNPPLPALARVKLELGVASRWLGETDAAREALDEAIADFGEAGDFEGQAESLVELALLHETAGRHVEATDAYQRAAAAGKRYHDSTIERRALIGLAGLALAADQPALALKRVGEALATFGGDPPDGQAMSMLGFVYLQLGDAARSIEAGEKALALLQEEGDLPKQARAHLRLGMAYHANNQPDQAVFHLESVS